jgi:C_GCAxxG_C_C family probable redox protein
MNPTEKSQLAKHYFEEGYNCAQSVLLAFCEETGLSIDQAAKLASTFGGGMGRMREVCGAVSAMFMIQGLMEGYTDPKAKEEKAELYARVRDVADRFREKNHSIICRDLLIDVQTMPGGVPEERTQEYYERRPCGCYVEDAAGLIAEALNA